YQLLLIEKLPELVKTQVEAIKNIKIDKITVWDGNNGKNGNTSTANFLAGLMKSVPPLNDLFNQAGMELPKYLGQEKEPDTKTETETEL
ncbi:MAG: flotillin family protein, partial [Bacteroidales bacterium]|nr:flotillin family protein [Bacteroidales bacterium]